MDHVTAPPDHAAGPDIRNPARPVPARRPAAAAIQLHGGIGFTWEHEAHLYYRNAISQKALSGDPKAQLGRLPALLASE